MVLVYGDTNTTLAGAITAAKLKIAVAHVEAGIRMRPRDMPEEINRVLTDRISGLCFCPSKLAVGNLKQEGLVENVHFVGDVMFDLYLAMENKFQYDLVEKFNLKENSFTLVTLHRDYNVDDKSCLETILKELKKIGHETQIVFPMHPRTKKRIDEFELSEYLNGFSVTSPVDYLNLMGLLKMSDKVITDSGGLQKEAYFAGKQALVLMPDTGWQELIDNNWNMLAGGHILYQTFMTLSAGMDFEPGVYGLGDAGKRIADLIVSN